MSSGASVRSGKSSLRDLFEDPPPRQPVLPPRSVLTAMLSHSHKLAAFLGAVLLLTWFVSSFIDEPGFLTVALLLFVMAAWVAVSRALFSLWLWRSGILTEATVLDSTPIEQPHVRDGVTLGTGYVHKARVSFKDQAGRPWEAAFSTTETSLDTGFPERLDLIYVAPPVGRLRAVVLVGSEPYYGTVLSPGQSMASRWFRWCLKAIPILGALAAAYVLVPAVRFRIDYFIHLVLVWLGWR
jgi:hypothetical protein